jgi:xanthine dehydrogenase iron-sulfur cluster and FAD-binding subunit A
MWKEYFTPATLDQAVGLLANSRGKARIVAGATDLIIEYEQGLREGISALIDISRIPGLDRITNGGDGYIHLGPLVTHNHCAGSPVIREHAYALARACWEVGAPQIRNRGTVAGNLITASPANDTIAPLMAFHARVHLRSERGERVVPLLDFYAGVRKTVMEEDEILTSISFPAPASSTVSAFLKVGLRNAQAISVINTAAVLAIEDGKVEKAAIALGSVAPTVIRARPAEEYLAGKALTGDVIEKTGKLAGEAARPIDDLRGSAVYRQEMVRVAVVRALRSLASGAGEGQLPERPVMLWGASGNVITQPLPESSHHDGRQPIRTRINGEEYEFTSGHDKTLLRLLREEAGLVGTKEGCAEGECGACTIFLDGIAVMACLVPAPRAHGANIETIEGLARNGHLHPVQIAFIEEGAVQCGYCTPGFVMSGVKLLEEIPAPSREEAKPAVTGNLCRCTGYYKIINAIERAAEISNA